MVFIMILSFSLKLDFFMLLMRRIGLHPLYPALRDAVFKSVQEGATAIGISCRQGRHRSVAAAENLRADLQLAGVHAGCVHLEMSTWPAKCLQGTCDARCCYTMFP